MRVLILFKYFDTIWLCEPHCKQNQVTYKGKRKKQVVYISKLVVLAENKLYSTGFWRVCVFEEDGGITYHFLFPIFKGTHQMLPYIIAPAVIFLFICLFILPSFHVCLSVTFLGRLSPSSHYADVVKALMPLNQNVKCLNPRICS